MKNLFLVIAFACLANTSFAQFSIGLTAGGNASHLKWYLKSLDEDLGYENALGWRAALLSEWQVSPLLALRAEIAGQLKSHKIKLESDITNHSGYLRDHYQYWEGSLLAQVSPLKKIRQMYLLAGCTAGRLTKAWQKIDEGLVEGGSSIKRDLDLDENYFNRNAFAADFGIGGNIPLGAVSSLKIEGRYQLGLSNFSSHDNVEARNNTFIFSVGYLHRI